MRRAVAAWLILLITLPIRADEIIYQTGFESPPYFDGNLLGQQGWHSTNNPPTIGRGIVQSAFAHTGMRAFRFDASIVTTSADWYWKDLSHAVNVSAATVIQITWDMYLASSVGPKSAGWGIDVYDHSAPLQRRVTAVIVNAQGRLLVWNGNNFHDTGFTVSRDQWHALRLDMNYAVGKRKVVVFLNDTLVALNRSFSPNTTNVLADVDLYNIDALGTDHAFFDNLSVIAPDDADGDGIPNLSDLCPSTAASEPIDADGCSLLDDDGDGVTNDFDECPVMPACVNLVTPNGYPVDTDGDGVFHGCDNCPVHHNPFVTYHSGDSFGDCALLLGLVNDHGLWQPDIDCDGIGNPCDECPETIPGDINVDLLVDSHDLRRFVELVMGDHAERYERCAGDCNKDSVVDHLDIPGFAALLLQ